MKKQVTAYGFLLLLISCSSTQLNEIDQQRDTGSDKEIVLLKVSDDSRCPEGVQCVWAGEATMELASYQGSAIIEKKVFVINRDSNEEITQWLSTHLAPRKEKLKGFRLVPYPKEGIVIQPQDYKIELY